MHPKGEPGTRTELDWYQFTVAKWLSAVIIKNQVIYVYNGIN